MNRDKKGLFVNIGGVPVDLNAGMIEAISNPPPGFTSKRKFVPSDVAGRLKNIDWFSQCGKPVCLDLTVQTKQVGGWDEAISACKSLEWENVQLEAQNQLTLFLHNHDRANYQNWNHIVAAHKESTVNPLTRKKLTPFQTQHGLDITLVHSVQWDVLGALMEDSYLNSGHSAFFFLEMLLIYEAGHVPCGWHGQWPSGTLVIY